MIPVEAVEAAARAAYERVRPQMGFPTAFDDAPEAIQGTYRGIARAALAAAAPYMRQEEDAETIRLRKDQFGQWHPVAKPDNAGTGS